MTVKRLEVVSIPVSDQERAKRFYAEQLGFAVVNDAPFGAGQRWVQLSPGQGAQTTITLVNWLEAMPPGSAQGHVLEVANLEAARDALRGRGVEVDEVQDTPWGKFAGFSDPDGNGWVLHQA